MLIVENTESNEILRFVVVDASVQLGEIKVGDQVKRFDPERVLTFFKTAEDHLLELANKYPDTFQYLPRKTYEYLRPPPILGEVYQSSASEPRWMVDFFITQPLIRVGHVTLPKNQQVANTRLTREWAIDSFYAPRLYVTQDLRFGRIDPKGWLCVLRAKDLRDVFKTQNRNDVLDHIKYQVPILIEMESPDDLPLLLEWLVFVKKLKLQAPRLILSLRSYEDWGDTVIQLLEIPRTHILTSGATVAQLTHLIEGLKEKFNSEWSRKLVFASSYPETQFGDSLVDIVSLLLSKIVKATPTDLHRILGGNILGLFPPSPRFFKYVESKNIITAEGNLGRASAKEIARFIEVLMKRTEISVVSADYMVNMEGEIDTDNMVITLFEDPAAPARCLAIRTERDGTLIVSGWHRKLADTLQVRNSELFTTLMRAAAKSGDLILDSPAHLNQFGQFLVKCLKLKDGKDLLSALHYRIKCVDREPGTVGVCPRDMKTLEVADRDVALLLHGDSTRWWGTKILSQRDIGDHEITMSQQDARLFGLGDGESVDIVRYDSIIQDLDDAVFAFHTNGDSVTAEDGAHLYLHSATIKEHLKSVLIGKGTTVFVGNPESQIKMTLVDSDPPLMEGQLARIESAEIRFIPKIMLRDMNIIICISLDAQMDTMDVGIKTLYSIKRRLEPLCEIVPEITTFLNNLDTRVTRAEAAALISLMVLNDLLANRGAGRLGLVTVADDAEKFSIQKGDTTQHYAEFSEDLSSKQVVEAMVYSILDAMRDSSTRTEMSNAYRAVAELLEDFGDELPTLVIMLGDSVRDPDEDPEPFLRSIAAHSRYRLVFLSLGTAPDDELAERMFESIRGGIININSVATFNIDNQIFSAIQDLC